ncbi:signaling lymphocytic activation molecule, partial [Lates calcarifer]|uniref:Signaling lymphocytic activation molecule n=1 Tax=Lates calcarifer TaxID=8187 RepID=A0AAJ7Q0E9_LATCA
LQIKDQSVTEHPQFKDRVSLNPTNYSLTVRGLTLQDSGEFSFVSEVNEKQRPTVTVTLQVHADPVLTVNSTWHASNESCTVLLECTVTSDSGVTYKWAVRNQSLSGSRLQYILRPQDGETTFTCTVSFFKENLEICLQNSECSNNISDTHEAESSSSSLVALIVRPIIGILLIILLLLCLLHNTKIKDGWCNRPTQTGNQDETPQHVYSSLLHGDGSVYETAKASEDAWSQFISMILVSRKSTQA